MLVVWPAGGWPSVVLGGNFPDMTIVIDAGRCVLREWRLDDADALVCHGNDRRISINTSDRFPFPYTPAHAAEWLGRTVGVSPPTAFAILEPGTDEPVGGIGLMPREDVERIATEIGYWLGVTAWGRGIATDAVKAVTAYAFESLAFERVFGVVYTRNQASARVLEKSGYILEGTMRRAAIKEGVVLDQFMYAATKPEWRRTHAGQTA